MDMTKAFLKKCGDNYFLVNKWIYQNDDNGQSRAFYIWI